MRYSIVFVAMAAAVSAQSTTYPSGYVNPFTTYLSETNSLGVVTGMPPVNTDVNTDVATSEPSVVTSQPAVATSPAGTPSVIPTLSTHAGSAPLATGSSGNGTSSTNGTVASGTLKSSSKGSKASSTATSASNSNSNVGGSGSSSNTASSSSSSSTGKSSAGMLEPAVGLGLAGALFAAFL